MVPMSKATARSPGSGDVQVRHATIVRCDIVGSTRIKKQLDLDDQLAFRQAWEEVVANAAERYGGHVESFEGDGALVVFGYPDAHEDMAESAVRMALALLTPGISTAAMPRPRQPPTTISAIASTSTSSSTVRLENPIVLSTASSGMRSRTACA